MKLSPIFISSFIFLLTACTSTADTFQSATPSQRTDAFNPTLPPMGVSSDHGKSIELYNGACGNNTISYEKTWDLGG